MSEVVRAIGNSNDRGKGTSFQGVDAEAIEQLTRQVNNIGECQTGDQIAIYQY